MLVNMVAAIAHSDRFCSSPSLESSNALIRIENMANVMEMKNAATTCVEAASLRKIVVAVQGNTKGECRVCRKTL